MQVTVAVIWKDARAYYTLKEDSYRVVECLLYRYEGAPADAPPSFFLLIQSGQRWISNLEQPGLVEAIGQSIALNRGIS